MLGTDLENLTEPSDYVVEISVEEGFALPLVLLIPLSPVDRGQSIETLF